MKSLTNSDDSVNEKFELRGRTRNIFFISSLLVAELKGVCIPIKFTARKTFV